MFTYELATDANRPFEITGQLRDSLAVAAITSGIVVVHTPHTTAGIAVIACPDPLVLDDLMGEIGRLVPTRVDFRHQFDTPQDAAGHIKSALVGSSLTLIVDGGALVLGHAQRVYFVEFDGPRQRKFHVQVMGS